MAKRFGTVKTYEEWCEPKLVSNTLELLDNEIPKLKDKIKSVQLCFTTDPFMENYPEVKELSLKSIRKSRPSLSKTLLVTLYILLQQVQLDA